MEISPVIRYDAYENLFAIGGNLAESSVIHVI